ncbi:hypothetical protein DU508_21720 [Pedobacter chinensis]|uniref:Uncharacterized protein n=1 Tax=Pedobacter chinensis TaxID=2282421 RepID=A0A369PP17_9SPHI|nr:hypothetical protein [Pedobacter chinensis]RDC54343.1 hypothetical protein DU508_21720 [Pedobacter chinensis]
MDELLGMPVMVHPQLTQDPVLMRGQVGTVIGADLHSDTIVVAFGNKGAGSYHSDALLVLKPHNELYKDLLEKVKQLKIADFKSLLRLSMHQSTGSPRQIMEAMAALKDSPQALDFATRPLPEMLEMDYGTDLQQGNSIGMGR